MISDARKDELEKMANYVVSEVQYLVSTSVIRFEVTEEERVWIEYECWKQLGESAHTYER